MVVESAFHASPDQAGLLRFLKGSGWRWIAQVFSRGFTPGGTVREHLDSMRQQIEDCVGTAKASSNTASTPRKAGNCCGDASFLENPVSSGIIIPLQSHLNSTAASSCGETLV
jgi:hypothetical protein